MPTLPSGLTELVADREILSRFLTQSNQFGSAMAKPAAFLPNPRYRNTSVFRIGNDAERLQRIWISTSDGSRQLKAVAFITAGDVRQIQLDAIAEEPPDAHANLEKWPWIDADFELQKARQKELATQLASRSSIVLL